MRRHLEGIDLATTPALLRRATVIDDFAVHSNAATTHALSCGERRHVLYADDPG